jgi:C_GCAxxG_C_C family probable redox protein
MVIGLKFGSESATDTEAKEKTYAKTASFLKQFQEQNGSILCKDLVGCDLGTSEGRKSAKDRRTHETVCAPLVRAASEILGILLGGSPNWS